MTQLFHSFIYTQENCKHTFTQKLVHKHPQQHYLLQPKSGNNPNVHQWMNGLSKYSIHTIEYCSAVKRNEVLIHATTWMNLEKIMPS